MIPLSALQSAAELGFIYSLVALALFLSFRILNIADMTTDGAFTLGCAVSAMLTVAGHPLCGIFAAMPMGALAGLITAVLCTRFSVPPILSGIITNTGLYTVNLAVMGFSSNVNMLGSKTIFTLFGELVGKSLSKFILTAFIAIFICVLLSAFLKTHIGLCVRATGDNPDMVRASSINTAFTVTLGLCASNAMTALSGAVLAQYQRTADINLGTGMVVIGLASLIIGESFFVKRSFAFKAAGAVLGSIVYRLVIAAALKFDLPAEALKLVSAVIVALAIIVPGAKKKRKSSAGEGNA